MLCCFSYSKYRTELQTSTFVPEYLSNYIFQGAILDPYSSKMELFNKLDLDQDNVFDIQQSVPDTLQSPDHRCPSVGDSYSEPPPRSPQLDEIYLWLHCASVGSNHLLGP